MGNSLLILVAILGVDWLLCKIIANPQVNKIIDIIALILIFLTVLYFNVGVR